MSQKEFDGQFFTGSNLRGRMWKHKDTPAAAAATFDGPPADYRLLP